MHDILTDARATVSGVIARIHYHYPRQTPQFPCAVMFESENRVAAQCDGEAHLSEIELTIEVWALSPGETHALSLQADQRLSALGMRRMYCSDLYDVDAMAHRRVMRYRALCDESGVLTQ